MAWEIGEISFRISFGISYMFHLLGFFYYNDIHSYITQKYFDNVTEYSFYENMLVVLIISSLSIIVISFAFPLVLVIQCLRNLGKINFENIDPKYVEKFDFFYRFFLSILILTLILFPLVYYIIINLFSTPRPQLLPENTIITAYVTHSIVVPRGNLEITSPYGRADKCIICMENDVDVKFLPCEHQIICRSCYIGFDPSCRLDCMLCRKEVETLILFSKDWLKYLTRRKEMFPVK